jgi:undecaprenyl diphosphate synthase
MQRFREISRVAFEMGIRCFTFFAASENNLRGKSTTEISTFLLSLRQELESKDTLGLCLKKKVRVRVIGGWCEILHNSKLLGAISFLEERTKLFSQHFLTILFGYSGMGELLDCIRTIIKQRPGQQVNEAVLKKVLWTGALPSVDLMIKTGSEPPDWGCNKSGILNPWLTPDTRIFSSQVLWPNFTAGIFRQIIAAFSKAPRRLGT